jgi:hypothetical protein
MVLRDKMPSWRNALWIGVALLYCVWHTYYALTEYNHRAHDPRAYVGHANIDLEKLHYKLTYDDLQLAGMFAGTRCSECDFSASSHIPLFWGDADRQLFGVLGKRTHRLTLTFYYYGENFADARRRVDHSLGQLRAMFPGQGESIAGGSGSFQPNPRPEP